MERERKKGKKKKKGWREERSPSLAINDCMKSKSYSLVLDPTWNK